MRRPFPLLISFLAFATLVSADALALTVPTMIRGGRAVLLRPEPGELSVTVKKRDLNIYDGEDTVRAMLYDPLGEELATLDLSDDASAEKTGRSNVIQGATITAKILRPGVYRLAVTCGHDLVYGLETNCEQVVFEGDIMLNEGEVSTQICFQPPEGEFDVTAQAIHQPGLGRLPLKDASGLSAHVFDFTEPGKDIVETITENLGDRSGVWTFDVAKADVKMVIEGGGVWSTSPDAYFDLMKTRWMLLPRLSARYLKPGETAEVPITLRNRTGVPAEFRVTLGAARRLELQADDIAEPVSLDPDEERVITVSVAAPGAKPGDVLPAFLTARSLTDPTIAESAGIEIRIGEPAVAKSLNMPIIHKRYRHEDVQFGYAPDYMTNEVYFDLDNRPWIRERMASMYRSTGVLTLNGGEWSEQPFADGLDEQYGRWSSSYGAGGFLGAKVAFDEQNGRYTCMRIAREDKSIASLLIYRAVDGERYHAYQLPGGAFDIEQFTGHNALPHPPPVLSYVTTGPHPSRFCTYNDLLLYMPTRADERLDLGEPVKITDNCLGSCQHSGGPASTATRDGKTHVVWGEVTDDDAPGVPTYIATYDHATGEVGEKVLLAHGAPVNDVHNVPAVVQDSEGYIHVVSGAHGKPFHYRRSLKPND
ncbi:MAG TPA: BNR-4 repeat-containing protein, partial [Armatimonadota bacterium]|nr:BNR-4 repeat-containing protein [Armatimonadota bacterium]